MDAVGAFVVVAFVVIATPGPDTALTIRNTLIGQRRGGLLTAAGVAAGQATWTVATALGVAALLAASEPLFRTVRLMGGAYLIFLGAQSLYGALRPTAERKAAVLEVSSVRARPLLAFRQGVISNLTNPKMAAFFPALLPQFAPSGDSPVLLGFGFLFCAMTLAWLSGYAWVVARAGDFLRRPRIRRALEAATGAVLVALGLRLATERR